MELFSRDTGEDPTDVEGTIVFVHGFPFDGAMWQGQLEALPDGWRGLAPDLRGFGQSPVGAEGAEVPTGADTGGGVARPTEPVLTMDLLADDIARLIERAEAAPAVVCGLSMGGYVAFALWRRRPDLIRALVLVDTRSEPETDEGREQRMRMAQATREAGAEPVAASMLPDLLSGRTRDRRPDLVDRVRGMMLATPPGTIIAALAGMSIRKDSTTELPRIGVPTLVVVGHEDAIIRVDTARAMASAIPGARLEVIEDAGHLPNIEEPARFNAILGRFLGSLPPS